eukprot:COSAG06_NODE_13985_length_1199_cov_929.434545_1_plen_399_part_11
MEACVGAEVVSSCMALHTLGCRNGIALCGRVDAIETGSGILCRWVEHASSGGGEYEAGAASGALMFLCAAECSPKMSPESREQIEKAAKVSIQSLFAATRKALVEQQLRDMYTGCMKVGMLTHNDISLACGCSMLTYWIGYMHPGAFTTANDCGLFSTALELYRRVEPSPLPEQWWSRTCDVVDVTSARIMFLWSGPFAMVKRLPSATQSSWWTELLGHAIRMSKLNASAGLSGRDTMAQISFVQSLSVVEVAAQDESQHEMLLASGVADALEYAILHDFTYGGGSVAACASGAAVALVGRNEGGKALRREAVHAVLERLQQHFRPESYTFSVPPKAVMTHLKRIPIMVVSDANKKHMLQFEPLIDMLLECLIINDDNHRKGQDGADMLQEASAGVLHE